jgi:xanthine dehydrogenase small subunit
VRDYVHLYINGRPFEIRGEQVFLTLSGFLRDVQRQVGTKIVCEEGDCGACTVLIGRSQDDEIVYRPVNSCILQMHQLDCTHVITVEGLSQNGTLHEVQESMVRHHGAQCGFCTPGFITAMAAMFERSDSVTEHEVERGLTGNLCRCTGYEPIIKAATMVDPSRIRRMNDLYPPDEMVASFEERKGEAVTIEASGRKFESPVYLQAATAFKGENTGAVIVQGATDVGVWCNKRYFEPEAVLNLSKIPGLGEISLRDGVLEVGGCVTLFALQEFVRDLIPQLWEVLEVFGSPQIRHAGTLAGNIANGSPIADTLPFLYVVEAELELTGWRREDKEDGGSRLEDRGSRMEDGNDKSVAATRGELTNHESRITNQPSRITDLTHRRVPIRSFYRGYKTFDLAPDEIITRIIIPVPAEDETLRLFKVSKRRDLDISSFTAAFLMSRSGTDIESMRIAYGGVGPVVYRLVKTEDFLTGREITERAFAEAGAIARKEITPISDVRGSKDFRFQLAESILLKFFHEATGEEVAV